MSQRNVLRIGMLSGLLVLVSMGPLFAADREADGIGGSCDWEDACRTEMKAASAN